jgi:hypothetical protein
VNETPPPKRPPLNLRPSTTTTVEPYSPQPTTLLCCCRYCTVLYLYTWHYTVELCLCGKKVSSHCTQYDAQCGHWVICQSPCFELYSLGPQDLRRRTEIIPVKDPHTRIKPLALTSSHGRYITVTPERTPVSVG